MCFPGSPPVLICYPEIYTLQGQNVKANNTSSCHFYPGINNKTGRTPKKHAVPIPSLTPDSELNFDDESLWFTFTATPSDGKPEQLRVAVSPAGKTAIQLYKNGVDISLRAYELNQVSCDVDNTFGSWDCTISIPWNYLPVGVGYHQVIHR